MKIFCQPAVSVHPAAKPPVRWSPMRSGARFILNSTTVHRINAMPASIWLEMPNSGHSVLMPPSGSTTP